MNEMLNKKDVLDAIEKKMKVVNEADGDADVILGLAAAMSVVKNMEGEPCTDAISRAEVLSHAKTDRGNGHEQPFDYVEVDVIRQLPPVTPTEKVGHWISIGDFECRCSECHLWCYKRNRSRYCPNCGAKMQEVHSMKIDESKTVLTTHREHWERLLSEGICDAHEGIETISALTIALASLEAWEKVKAEIEDLERSYGFDKATKYGNKDEKQMDLSYSTMYMYEIAGTVDEIKDIIDKHLQEVQHDE